MRACSYRAFGPNSISSICCGCAVQVLYNKLYNKSTKSEVIDIGLMPIGMVIMK